MSRYPCIPVLVLSLLTYFLVEVVLATMVPRFKISLANNADEIYWNLANVRYPTVGKFSDKPEYPIKLERIEA